MKRALLICLLLSACHPTAEELSKADHASCSEYGYKKGSQDYAACRLTLDQNRKAQEANKKTAIGAALVGKQF